jgi:hypothetical protein
MVFKKSKRVQMSNFFDFYIFKSRLKKQIKVQLQVCNRLLQTLLLLVVNVQFKKKDIKMLG